MKVYNIISEENTTADVWHVRISGGERNIWELHEFVVHMNLEHVENTYIYTLEVIDQKSIFLALGLLAVFIEL